MREGGAGAATEGRRVWGRWIKGEIGRGWGVNQGLFSRQGRSPPRFLPPRFVPVALPPLPPPLFSRHSSRSRLTSRHSSSTPAPAAYLPPCVPLSFSRLLVPSPSLASISVTISRPFPLFPSLYTARKQDSTKSTKLYGACVRAVWGLCASTQTSPIHARTLRAHKTRPIHAPYTPHTRPIHAPYTRGARAHTSYILAPYRLFLLCGLRVVG